MFSFSKNTKKRAVVGLRRRGIGIVEISFVALAMLVLTGLAIPKFMAVVQSAKTAGVQEVMHQIATSASNYYAETGCYPGGTSAGGVCTYVATTATPANFTGPSGKVYLQSQPADPADHAIPKTAFTITGASDAQGNDSFTIITPVVHDNATMYGLAGWSATQKHISYNSDGGFSAVP